MKPKKTILYIGNQLAAKGNTITVMESLSVHLRAEGYTVITASSKKNKGFRLLDMITSFYKNRSVIDAVLIDTYSTQNFQYAVIIGVLCRKYKIPYYPILHGGNLPQRLQQSPKKSRTFFSGAATNIAPSHYLLQAFKNFKINNVQHIPNSIELQEYPFKQRNKVTAKLLWVRSFSKIYNPMLALDIVENLLKKNIEVSLTMVGPEKDGSLTICKESAKKRNLPVQFTGLLSKKEWTTLSKTFDVFINTTDFDNMPVSIIEAMALGFPIISTNVGGLPHLIKEDHNGILVPPKNVDAFAKAIGDFIGEKKNISQLSSNARETAMAYDWSSIKHKWTALLGG